MSITIADDVRAAAEQLLCLSPERWGSHYRGVRTLLQGRLAEPESVPDSTCVPGT